MGPLYNFCETNTALFVPEDSKEKYGSLGSVTGNALTRAIVTTKIVKTVRVICCIIALYLRGLA